MFWVATSIVLIMTVAELWVGADSRVIAIGERRTIAPVMCKIHRFGEIFYVQAGLFKDQAGHFDAARLAHRTVITEKRIQEVARSFEVTVQLPLSNIVRELRDINREYYRTKVVGKPALQVAFFGFERGSLRLAVRSFIPRELPNGAIGISMNRLNCPGDCPGGMTWAFLGESREINRFLDSNPKYLKENGFRATLQTLIELEAVANPEYVSGPVDILSVTSTGAKWIQRKDECRW